MRARGRWCGGPGSGDVRSLLLPPDLQRMAQRDGRLLGLVLKLCWHVCALRGLPQQGREGRRCWREAGPEVGLCAGGMQLIRSLFVGCTNKGSALPAGGGVAPEEPGLARAPPLVPQPECSSPPSVPAACPHG